MKNYTYYIKLNYVVLYYLKWSLCLYWKLTEQFWFFYVLWKKNNCVRHKFLYNAITHNSQILIRTFIIFGTLCYFIWNVGKQFNLRYPWWLLSPKIQTPAEMSYCIINELNTNYICEFTLRGVDNGAAGATAAAPIIWLVVVIQKWQTFRRQNKFFFAFMNAIWVNFNVTNH